MLLLYVFSCAPGVYSGDSAELAAGAALLSFVHAPGYPLYLLLGHLFSRLPAGDVAYRLNLMSAFFGAVTVLLLARFCHRLTGHLPAAILAALAFGLSFTFREQANVAEVYTLNTCCLALLLNVALGWQRAAAADRDSYLLLFALLFALSLGGHVNPVFLVPAFAVFAGLNGFRPHRDPGIMPGMVLLFLLGLSLYLYLPIRAMDNPPVINWLKTDTPAKVWSVLSAERFRGQMFAFGPGQVLSNAGEGVVRLLVQFPLVGFILGLAGLRALWQHDRTWAWFTLIGGGTVFLYTINYDIVDRSVYYLPLYLLFTLPLCVALRDLWESARIVPLRAALIAALFVPYPFAAGLVRAETDRSHHYAWPDYARALDTLPPHSAVIAYWPQYTVLRYAQLIGGRRPDVRLVENSLLEEQRYLDDIDRHRHYGPLFCTMETAIVGTRWQLRPAGFFYRVQPPDLRLDTVPAGTQAPDWTTVPGQPGLGVRIITPTAGLKPRTLLPVELHWRLQPDATRPDTQPWLQLQLVDDQGGIAVRHRLFPVNAGWPVSRWQAGVIYRQERNVYLPASLPAGRPLQWRIVAGPAAPERPASPRV